MTHAFPKALQQRLWPVLRAEGFVGSGTTLRRFRGTVVHVFNIQGSSTGARCYLNLGAHLDFLPAEGGLSIEPKKLTESHCAFRGRIDPPPGAAFGWAYLDDVVAAQESIEFAVEAWRIEGRPFFEVYAEYPDAFRALVNKASAAELHPRSTLTYGRIALQLREVRRAEELARAGLLAVPEGATGLRADLKKLLATCERG
jgi:hypothetical protein